MPHALLEELAALNRPDQFALLGRTMEQLTQSKAVTHLLVRGSLAAGTADRLSDVDFVVGVEDAYFADFVTVLDALAITDLGALMPGWRDTIVGDMGGIGMVYLVTWEGKLQQIDLYVLPASEIDSVHRFTTARAIYVRDPQASHAADPQVASFVARARSRARSSLDLVIEALVVGYLIRKRISRGQEFIAYSEWHLFTTAAKNLVKASLAPHSRFYGWYQLDEEIGATPIGQECLKDLLSLIAAPPIPTAKSLADGIDRVMAIATRAAPEAVDTLGPAIDAYRHYLELP